MEPLMLLNSWKAGCVSRNRPVKGNCTSRCTGCLPTPLGSIRSRIWFSVLQRKHLQPNHFASTTALETSLGEFIAHYNQTAKPINWTYTVEKLEQKLAKLL